MRRALRGASGHSKAIQIIRNGGVLKNDAVKFYQSRYEVISCSIVLYLMRKYGIDVPLRTQGWINGRLASVTVRDGRCSSVRYLRSKRGRCSEAFFGCLDRDRLIRAVAERPPGAEAAYDATNISNKNKEEASYPASNADF